MIVVSINVHITLFFKSRIQSWIALFLKLEHFNSIALRKISLPSVIFVLLQKHSYRNKLIQI